MNNYLIEKYRQDIINITNNSGLLVGTAYYILKDILHEIEEAYQKSIEIDSATITTTETYEVDDSGNIQKKEE